MKICFRSICIQRHALPTAFCTLVLCCLSTLSLFSTQRQGHSMTFSCNRLAETVTCPGRMLLQVRRRRMSNQNVAPDANAALGSLQARRNQSRSSASKATLDSQSSIKDQHHHQDQPYHLRHSSWDVFVTVTRTAAHAGMLIVFTCLALCTMVLYIRAHTWVQGLSDQAFR